MSINGTIKDGKLFLEIDVSDNARKSAEPSASGKSLTVASTRGFTRFGDCSVSLNVTLPNPKYVKA